MRLEIPAVLIQQLGESIEESVPLIYNGINAQLAEHGNATQLQLNVQRLHGAGTALAGGRVASRDNPVSGNAGVAPHRDAADMVPIASAVDQAHGQADHPAVDLDLHDLSSHFSSERVDQPMESVRRMAHSGRRQEATGGLAPTDPTTPDVATVETCSSEAALVAPATRPIR